MRKSKDEYSAETMQGMGEVQMMTGRKWEMEGKSLDGSTMKNVEREGEEATKSDHDEARKHEVVERATKKDAKG